MYTQFIYLPCCCHLVVKPKFFFFFVLNRHIWNDKKLVHEKSLPISQNSALHMMREMSFEVEWKKKKLITMKNWLSLLNGGPMLNVPFCYVYVTHFHFDLNIYFLFHCVSLWISITFSDYFNNSSINTEYIRSESRSAFECVYVGIMNVFWVPFFFFSLALRQLPIHGYTF